MLAASRPTAPLVLAALMVGLCGCGVVSPPADSGAQGLVLLGPMCPGPQRLDHPCPDRPVSRAFEAFLFPPGFTGVPSPDRGHSVAHFSSGTDGRYRVNLRPGQYAFYSAHSGSPLPCQAYVTVRPHEYTTATVHCDTGMR